MKLKTNKSALKRIKCKKNFLGRKQAYKRHLLRKKTTKQLRKLSHPCKIASTDRKTLNYLLNI
jgi:ribosomal protein L35